MYVYTVFVVRRAILARFRAFFSAETGVGARVRPTTMMKATRYCVTRVYEAH